MSRRAVLTAVSGVALAGATLAGGGVARAGPPAVPRAARQRAMRFLDAMLAAHAASSELRLPQSYADQIGLYATGFTYDAALAILAYLDDDRPGSLDQARLLGQSLVYAQQHDPRYADGRLRQAYHVGPYTRAGVLQPYGFVRPDGTVNVGGAFGFTGSGTGECAWAALALCALHRRTGDDRFFGGAVRLGEWIAQVCRSSGPLGGFTAGTDRDGAALARVSTTHNADLVALFGQLAELTGDRVWLARRADALRLVTGMWSPVRQAFFAGTPDGASVEREPMQLEAQTHAWLALADLDRVGCLDTVTRRLTVTDTAASPNSALAPGRSFTGVTVSTASRTADPAVPIEPGLPRPDPDAVWLEGTAQYALALRLSPLGPVPATAALRTLIAAQARLGAGQTVAGRPLPAGGGVTAATSPLHVGFVASGYYPYAHVAATAWYLLAATGTNPLGGAAPWAPASSAGRAAR
ncbi:hypothetical protein [Krasilnikovia cinnamomea]|uniref:hypothetical protein n=1 Tax=Krasilnikovia cinnamomea TaxID=349313 RepID=UPI001A921389|nr:hypothetical protein [Krasilnikovia cinnamomea]